MAPRTILNCLYEPEKLEINRGCRIYGDKGGLKSYHYEEMIKRLSEMDEKLKKVDSDADFVGVGYLLRLLWQRYENELLVHTRSLYGGTHEQDIKSKKIKITKYIRFAKEREEENNGEYGVHTDLVYDTYQKDWSKAYQLTFHGFFSHIDYLSNQGDDKCFSYMHYSPLLSFINPDNTSAFMRNEKHQFGAIIIKDVKNLNSSVKLNAVHSLSLHTKAPLYDIMGGVLHNGKYPDKSNEQFGHDTNYWRGDNDNDCFYKRLSAETFAHMASSAIVNPPAFKALKDYLPNAYNMFLDILDHIALRLVKHEYRDTKVNNCACKGSHFLKIVGLNDIKSYTGNFPSPFQIMNYTPSIKEEPLFHQFFVPDKTIRKWIKDAAEYHEIPHEMIAVILQQENAPNAPKLKQILQFGERTLTTIAAQLHEKLGLDKVINTMDDEELYDKVVNGSAGFMNMRRPTLKATIQYTKEKYGRELMPTNVANRVGYFYSVNIDEGIQGVDWRADLYYGAAHIRQLVDQVMGGVCSKGEITMYQVQQVFRYYNGPGGIKYGEDAIELLKNAAEGKRTLYFYEK